MTLSAGGQAFAAKSVSVPSSSLLKSGVRPESAVERGQVEGLLVER
jgi:hypothetical protein